MLQVWNAHLSFEVGMQVLGGHLLGLDNGFPLSALNLRVLLDYRGSLSERWSLLLHLLRLVYSNVELSRLESRVLSLLFD